MPLHTLILPERGRTGSEHGNDSGRNRERLWADAERPGELAEVVPVGC
jgi:hypothetical protein